VNVCHVPNVRYLRTQCKRILRTDATAAMWDCAEMADETGVAVRLKALRERAGVSVREMARRMGMSPSSYTHYENRLKADFLPMHIAIQVADALHDRDIDRRQVMALAGAAADPGLSLPAAPVGFAEDEPAQVLVPVYAVNASAGPGAINGTEEIVDTLAFPPGYLRHLTRSSPKNLAIIGVKGDSMIPTLKDDDVVMIDMTKTDLSYDGLFVIRDGGDALLVKRIGRASRRGYIMIISDNPHVPPVERAQAEIEVVGKVIWRGVKE
jgi:phage repressor protein C with HTH and peptisase S24 domain